MKKAVVLYSGGLDTTTCMAIAKSQGFECYALTFDYGQKNRSEILAAQRGAVYFGAKEHQVLTIELGKLGGSALTDKDIPVPDYVGDNKIPTTYVPARNTIFLSFALAYAEVIGANDIFAGFCATDHAQYPDCRVEYMAAYQNMARLATKAGVNGEILTLHTPMLHLTKAETIQIGVSLGVDYSQTVTCYQATETGEACGRCDCCVLRRRGFVEAGVEDVTRYVALA